MADKKQAKGEVAVYKFYKVQGDKVTRAKGYHTIFGAAVQKCSEPVVS